MSDVIVEVSDLHKSFATGRCSRATSKRAR